MEMYLEPLCDAFKGGIMKCEDEVSVLREMFCLMVWVHSVHAFERADPRGLFHLADRVCLKASGRERVSGKRFVVRWSKEMSVGGLELDEHDSLVHRIRYRQ